MKVGPTNRQTGARPVLLEDVGSKRPSPSLTGENQRAGAFGCVRPQMGSNHWKEVRGDGDRPAPGVGLGLFDDHPTISELLQVLSNRDRGSHQVDVAAT